MYLVQTYLAGDFACCSVFGIWERLQKLSHDEEGDVHHRLQEKELVCVCAIIGNSTSAIVPLAKLLKQTAQISNKVIDRSIGPPQPL
ncbi:hypothetical protein TYRP_016571 [Tyrophagus putrescentiae]|nr:hypothetical protein TYRP_016571 [Tyrophagus putrescentiae]